MFVITGCDKKKENNKDIDMNRYKEIKNDFETGLKWNISVSYPNGCANSDSTTSYKNIITSSYLIQQGYIKKEIMLDVDGKSYCKANANTDCKDGKIVYDIYLNCKDYVDEGYVDWK
jgi:hypothetical protein